MTWESCPVGLGCGKMIVRQAVAYSITNALFWGTQAIRKVP